MRIFKNRFGEFEFRTHYIDTHLEAQKIISDLPTSIYGLDIETSKIQEYKEHERAGLDPKLSEIRLLQVYDGVDNVYVFDLFSIDIVHDAQWSKFLTSNRFVAHNAVFEISHLCEYGYCNLNIGCSMLMSQLVHGAEHSPYEPDESDEDNTDQSGLSKYRRSGHSLDAVVSRFFGIKVEKAMQVSDWGVETLSNEQITYAGLDALLTYKVAMKLQEKIKAYKMVKHYKLLKDMQHVVVEMQANGLPVDWEYHAKLMQEWKEKSVKALAACKPHFGDINIRSTVQMNAWLKDYRKTDPMILAAWPKTKKGSYAFGKTAIAGYTHLPPIAALLEYKKWAKLLDTYGESLVEKKHPITNRLHASYTLGMTVTGRLSSREPNQQNYPREQEFRNIFRAEKDHVLVVSDFSQIEVRLQAEFSKDPVMCQAFQEGSDLYCTFGSILYGRKITKEKNKAERQIAKTAILALAYGMGSVKLFTYALASGIKQPQRFWDRTWKTYHNTFHVYSAWCNKIRRRAEHQGYIETLLGKRRKLEDDQIYCSAPNHVIQGTASELMQRALIICKDKVNSYAQVCASVHDEILLHCHKKYAERASNDLSTAMNSAMKELFPKHGVDVADAGYGERWGDIKKAL